MTQFRNSILRTLLLGSGLVTSVVVVLGQPAARPPESPAMRQMHQALSLAQRGDAHGAMQIVDHLLRQNARFVPALKLKGMILEEEGNTAEAAEYYEQGLKLAPDDPDLLLKAGIYRLAAGKKQQAIAALVHCARLSPRDGDVQFYLAQAYHLNGQDSLALRAIEQSAKLEPDNAPVLQKYGELLTSAGRYEDALPWLLKARAADATLPHIDYEIGLTNYKLMALPDAVQSLSRAVAAHPNDSDALALLASVQLRLNRWADAKTAFSRYLAAHPDDIEALLGFGHCQLELRENDAAVQTLQRVLKLDPRQLIAHFYLSRAYAALGNPAEAQRQAALHHLMMEKATFVRAAEAEQREQEITPKTRELLSDGRQQEALTLYHAEYKNANATLADAYAYIGKEYLYIAKPEDGLRCLHHAIELQPTVRGAHTSEGILDLSRGDFAAAEMQFRAEMAIDPNAQTAIAEMGEVRYRQQRWEEAAKFFEQSKTMTPQLLFMQTDTYFRLGRTADANLNADLVAAYGSQNEQLMRDLLDLLQRNNQQAVADRIASELKP